MFREFYLQGSGSWLAWLGLAVLFLHSIFSAVVKKQLNSWSGDFYNLLQTVEVGSGSSSEDQARVVSQLWSFVGIVAPMALAHPVSQWVRNVWTLEWRLCLVNNYLSRWNNEGTPVEGASQRIQEDTARFAQKFDGAIGTLLNATMTLIVFIPVLSGLGSVASPPGCLAALGNNWLVYIAVVTASLHLGGAWLIGRPLVSLEITNQRVEAAFRLDLVLQETEKRDHSDSASARLVRDLRANYNSLYRNFFGLNFFLSTFDQVLVLLPYVLVAPLLFADENNRVRLGVLVQVSNSFDRVFGALTVVAENYAALQDFRSTVHRLLEFERSLTAPSHAQLVSPGSELSSDMTAQRVSSGSPQAKYNNA